MSLAFLKLLRVYKAPAKRSKIFIQHHVGRTCLSFSRLSQHCIILNGFPCLIKFKHYHPTFCVINKCLIFQSSCHRKLARAGKSDQSQAIFPARPRHVIIAAGMHAKRSVGSFIVCPFSHSTFYVTIMMLEKQMFDRLAGA